MRVTISSELQNNPCPKEGKSNQTGENNGNKRTNLKKITRA